MYEGLKGVVVFMTVVPLPLGSILIGQEVTCAPVVSQTAEPKETPTSRELNTIIIIIQHPLLKCLYFLAKVATFINGME